MAWPRPHHRAPLSWALQLLKSCTFSPPRLFAPTRTFSLSPALFVTRNSRRSRRHRCAAPMTDCHHQRPPRAMPTTLSTLPHRHEARQPLLLLRRPRECRLRQLGALAPPSSLYGQLNATPVTHTTSLSLILIIAIRSTFNGLIL